VEATLASIDRFLGGTMAITIRSSFKIDANIADVWTTMVDIERSAPCFPGAELQDQQPDGSYKGAFTVKLGPLTLKFAGKFKIAEQNDAERVVVVAASGTDTKGRGGAEANIRATVSEDGGKTKVDVVSDVNLSGTVAQYGRGAGMIEALSQQLLNQFAKNLTALIESEAEHQVAQVSEPAAAATQNDASAGSGTNLGGTAGATPATTPGAPLNAAAAAASPGTPGANTTAAGTPRPAPVRRPPAPVVPLDAGALMRKAMWQSIRNFFARLFGAKQQH
jgi:carbon monoxide dehydrogenase subunit G